MIERKSGILDLRSLYTQAAPTVSFELFPPKKWKGFADLYEHFQELAQCKPAFVTCTYGAGGSTQARTLEVLKWVREDYPDLPLGSHLTLVGATTADLRAFLQQAREQAIDFIVALRGDPPQGADRFRPVPGGLAYANELVELIRGEFPDFGVIVGGYPEKHPEAPSMEVDLENLKRKVDAGADVITTQLFYDNTVFYRFRDACEKIGIDIPIVPGILPVMNTAQVKRITQLCGASIPAKLMARLDHHREEEEGQFAVGLYHAARQVEDLLEQGAPGIHFYVLNKSRMATLICRALTL